MNVHLVKYERSFIKYKKNCQGINLLTVILSNTFCPGLNRSRETMIQPGKTGKRPVLPG